MQQGSPEWFAARCGKVTASRISDIIAKTKTGPSASRKNYMAQLVAERLTGIVEEGFTNAAMLHGTETEPLARAEYEIITGEMVDQVGFIDHPEIELSGASPDGLVSSDGMIEIKCPNTATHIEYFVSDVVPAKYKPQMTWQLACAKRQWVDFVSYDPRMPKRMQLFVKRFSPTYDEILSIENEVKIFLIEVEDTIQTLMRKVA